LRFTRWSLTTRSDDGPCECVVDEVVLVDQVVLAIRARLFAIAENCLHMTTLTTHIHTL